MFREVAIVCGDDLLAAPSIKGPKLSSSINDFSSTSFQDPSIGNFSYALQEFRTPTGSFKQQCSQWAAKTRYPDKQAMS